MVLYRTLPAFSFGFPKELFHDRDDFGKAVFDLVWVLVS
jgi:hypothetical protein